MACFHQGVASLQLRQNKPLQPVFEKGDSPNFRGTRAEGVLAPKRIAVVPRLNLYPGLFLLLPHFLFLVL